MRFASKLVHALCAWLCTISFAADNLSAQSVSELPRTEYYVAMELFGTGRIPEAMEGFNAAFSLARRTGERRWIDSIPPLVMLGECHYQQGSLALALEQYDAALQLAIANPRWIDQFDVGPEQLPAFENVAKGINWFPKTLVSRSVAVPEAVQIVIDPTQAQASPGNGIAAPISLVTRLDATEVLRTMAVAMFRRWQILGPLAKHSPLSVPVSQLFAFEPNQQAAWVNSSWRVLRGISQLSTPTSVNAPAIIRSGMLLGNQFDYFMSPTALLVLAELEARQGNYQAAITALQDASLLAAQFEQHGELAASLQLLSSCAAASRRIELIEPIRNVANWCGKRSNLSRAAATIGAAELAVYANNLPLADRLNSQIAPALRSRELALPRATAQSDFVGALIAFGQNRAALGLSKLNSALKFMHGSAQSGAVVETVFQAQLTLNLLAEGRLTKADAEDALVDVLAEPAATQWQIAPLTTLASITTSSMPAYERLLELAEARGDQKVLVERLDRLQRQRFYEALPLGGRLLCWREAIHSPLADLPADVRAVVENTNQNFPLLQNSVSRIEAIVEQLRLGPFPLDERQLPNDQKSLFSELSDLSEVLENRLVFQSLLRGQMPRFLPPATSLEVVQEQLDEGDVFVALAATRQSIYAVAINRDSADAWQVSDVAGVTTQLQSLVSSLGLISRELPKLPSSVLAKDAGWIQNSVNLLDLLFPLSVQTKIAESRRVIIAPQDKLWYLPFELLPLSSDPAATRWIEGRSITYIPTLGSLPQAFSEKPNIRQTVGIVDSFFSIDRESNMEQAQQLLAGAPNSVGIFLNQKVTVPSPVWLRLHCDQLWLAARAESASSGWDAIVMPLGKPLQSTIRSWLQTPEHAPKSVLLPGWNTSIAEGELRNGDEIFLPVCGMLVSGVKTALISRWPVGGKSAKTLLQNYLQELRTESSSAALRRATLALWPENFLVADEPGLLPAGKEAAALTTGHHPVLWAGYMAIGDTLSPTASTTEAPVLTNR